MLTDAKDAQAIVILSSGLRRDADEYGGDTVTGVHLRPSALRRDLSAAPSASVLVTGGQPRRHMAQRRMRSAVLENEFGVADWLARRDAEDTADDATLSAQILRAAGMRASFWLRKLSTCRARYALKMRVSTSAGTNRFQEPRRRRPDAGRLGAQAYALHNSYYALHEWLGISWFELVKVFRPAP